MKCRRCGHGENRHEFGRYGRAYCWGIDCECTGFLGKNREFKASTKRSKDERALDRELDLIFEREKNK